MNKEQLDKDFDKDYPSEGDYSEFVGNMYDIYTKGYTSGYEAKEAEYKGKVFTLEDMIGLVEHVRYEDFSGKTYESIAKNYIQSLPSPPKQ